MHHSVMNVRAVVAMMGTAALLWISALMAQAPSQRVSLAGLVTRSGNATPVANARVTLSTVFGALAGFAVTDDKGRFSINSLNAGEYRLQVAADGYVPLHYGQRYADGPAASIALAVGPDVTELALSLTPTGSITGHLRDANKLLLPGALVELLHLTYDGSGQKQLQAVDSTRTDDRGEYRLFWVLPGRYYLRGGGLLANVIDSANGDPNPNEVLAIEIVAAYFPGAPDPGSARPIEVLPGAVLTGIDWLLSPRSLVHRIRVQVVDARTGKPPAAAEVAIRWTAPGFSMNSDPFSASGSSIQRYNPTTGMAVITDLPPGPYSITAAVKDAGAESRPLMGSTFVTITSSNVDDAVVTIAPVNALAGRIRFEEEAPAFGYRQSVIVQLNAVNKVGSPFFDDVVLAAVDPEGAFRMNNLGPGDYRLDVSMPGNKYLKSAQLGGVDVLDGPLRVTGPVTDSLDIVVGAQGGRIQGNLVDERSEPVARAQVVLVPNHARQRRDLYKTAVTDVSGRFTITGVAPGDYQAYSWQAIEPFSWFDAEVMAQWEDRGSPVHVSESSSATVAVKIIP